MKQSEPESHSVTRRLSRRDEEEERFYHVYRFDKRAKNQYHPEQIRIERKMLVKLKELKKMIDISAKFCQDQKAHSNNEYALRTRMWAIVGRYKYKFK